MLSLAFLSVAASLIWVYMRQRSIHQVREPSAAGSVVHLLLCNHHNIFVVLFKMPHNFFSLKSFTDAGWLRCEMTTWTNERQDGVTKRTLHGAKIIIYPEKILKTVAGTCLHQLQGTRPTISWKVYLSFFFLCFCSAYPFLLKVWAQLLKSWHCVFHSSQKVYCCLVHWL